MPASRTYRPTNGDILEYWVEGDLEGRNSVYFTDQSPVFKICVKNIADRPVGVTTRARISYDQSDANVEKLGNIRTADLLEPGETEKYKQKISMLSYQGTAAINIEQVNFSTRDDMMETRRVQQRYVRLYTFMVYDRDYYKVNHLNPRRAQYLAAFLSVVVVLVGIVQIVLAA